LKHINLITQEEIETMKRIDEDCKRLHIMPPPKSFLTIEVKSGETIKEKLTSLSKSWTRNAYNQLTQQLLGLNAADHGLADYVSGGLYQKYTNGTTSNDDYTALSLSTGWQGVANNSTYGLVIGIGTTAETFNDYALANQCTHGTGANQFSHGAGNISGVWNGSTKKWTSTITRSFLNSSGSTITVAETGIQIYRASGTYILYNRDVLSSAVDVPNGDTITVTYTIETTFP
jgi:hypothetical protein